MEKIETLTSRDTTRTLNYHVYCVHFLEVAKPLDALIAERNLQAAALTQSLDMPHQATIIVARSSFAHIMNLAIGIKDPLKNLGVSLTSAFLSKNVRENLRATGIVKEADSRAKFLLPQIGEDRVAMLLPQQLCTEDAAAFMYQGRHYALQTAINASLRDTIAQPAYTLE